MIKKILVLFIIFNILFSHYSFCDDLFDMEVVDVNSETSSISADSSNIKAPDINSRACIVIDRNSNIVLYGKNENQKRKMASTTKIMTSIIIIENYNLSDTVTISSKAASTGGSRLGLKKGDSISVYDLLYGLMLCSGNDAAVALAEYAAESIDGFAELMNNKAEELNLTNTHFETPHGLDSDNHYTTAYELAILSNYALNNNIFAEIVNTKTYTISISGISRNLSNTNELLGNFDGIYGIKTGFTNGANRCLVTACKRNNMDIICVVLGADSKKFRTQDSIKLLNYAFDNYTPTNLDVLVNNTFEEWKNNNNIEISKGFAEHIDLKIQKINYPIIPIRNDYIDNIEISIVCNHIVDAPILYNTPVGNINVFISNDIKFEYIIYIDTIIKKKTSIFYFFYILKNYFIFFNSLI